MKGSLESEVRRAQGGDLEAFGAIIRAYEHPIRAWVVSRCPPGGDADDVAQTTFINAFKRINEFTAGTDLRAWLFAIARFQLMAECTRLQRLADYHSRYAPRVLAAELARRLLERDEPDDERLDHLRVCVSTLEGDARKVIQWRYGDGLPLSEISSLTGRSEGALKKHLFMLRQKLHDCLSRKLSGESA